MNDWTGGTGADVAFEVSGSPDAAALVTEVVRVWGTVSIIAIHSEPVPFHLYSLFARELKVHGSRLYTRAAWEEAIRLVAERRRGRRPAGEPGDPAGGSAARDGGGARRRSGDEGAGRGRELNRPGRITGVTAPILELHDATVLKDDRPVLDSVSLTIAQRRAHGDRRAERGREVDPGQPAHALRAARGAPRRRPTGAGVRRRRPGTSSICDPQIGIVSADLHNRFVSGNSEGRITAPRRR